jgi:hypothetical protein
VVGGEGGSEGIVLAGRGPQAPIIAALCNNSNKQTNKNLRCGSRTGLLGRNDQNSNAARVSCTVPCHLLSSTAGAHTLTRGGR